MSRVTAGVRIEYVNKKKKVAFPEAWNTKGGSVAGANGRIMATGDGLVVVDVDTKDLSQIDQDLAAILSKYEPSQETARGSHYGFLDENSSDFVNRAAYTDYVDVRSDGGGVFYEYTGDRPKRISYTGLDPQSMDYPKMPKKLRKMLLSMVQKKKERLESIKPAQLEGDTWGEIEEGEVHDVSFALMGAEFKAGRSYDEVYSKAMRYVEKYYDGDPIEQEKFKDRVDDSSVYWEKGRTLEGEALEVEALSCELVLKTYTQLKSEKIRTVLLCGVPYPMKGLVMIAGDGGVGKSYIVIKQAVSYLEQYPNEKVLFWFTEDYEAIVRKRIEEVEASDEIKSRMMFIASDINSVKDPLEVLIKTTKDYGMVVLDPLISFFTGEENSNREARAFGNRLKLLSGLVLLIHHSSKSGAVSRGASDFRNMVRLVYEVKKPMTAYHAGKFTRWSEDEYKLGKRALLIDKDNWGITNDVPKDCRSADTVGFLLDVFNVSDEYKAGVKLSVDAVQRELDSLKSGRSVKIVDEDVIIELAHYKNRSALGGADVELSA